MSSYTPLISHTSPATSFVRATPVLPQAALGNNTDEEEAKRFLAEYDSVYGPLLNLATVAQWAYETNITTENSDAAQAAWLKVRPHMEKLLGKSVETVVFCSKGDIP
jgi:hypothetical protein